MATVSDGGIIKMILSGDMDISPFKYENVQPSSVDLTLNTHISTIQQGQTIDPRESTSELFNDKVIDGCYELAPGEMIVARIAEKITMPSDCCGFIQNRNSLIRLGLDVSLSGYINPGYSGQLPIVIKNIGTSTFKLIPGMRICQLVLDRTEEKPIRDYSQRKDAKYFGESSLRSLLHLDAEMQAMQKLKSSDLSEFIVKRSEEAAAEFLDSLSDEQKKEFGLI